MSFFLLFFKSCACIKYACIFASFCFMATRLSVQVHETCNAKKESSCNGIQKKDLPKFRHPCNTLMLTSKDSKGVVTVPVNKLALQKSK